MGLRALCCVRGGGLSTRLQGVGSAGLRPPRVRPRGMVGSSLTSTSSSFASASTSSSLAAEGEGDGGGDAKRAVRALVGGRLRGMTDADKAAQSAEVARRALGLPEVAAATRVAVFLSSARLHEVDTAPIIQGLLLGGARTVYAPRLVDGRTSPPGGAMRMLQLAVEDAAEAAGGRVNRHGVAEPSPGRPDACDAAGPLDLCLVPGVAFDARGGRIGRGGGYYDRWIAEYAALCTARGWRPPLLAALAFDCQVLAASDNAHLPMLPHDVRMDLVIAPSGVLRP